MCVVIREDGGDYLYNSKECMMNKTGVEWPIVWLYGTYYPIRPTKLQQNPSTDRDF
jgi:hypothetical protein